jgi:hypothetical protein
VTASDALHPAQFDYQTGHRPGGPEDEGSAMHDPHMMLPGDITHHRTGYARVDQESHRVMAATHGRPDADVKVYRSGPTNVINPGDWVTQSRHYAEIHKQSNGKPDWHIAERTVKAKHLHSEGNSVAEWGWHPE